MATTNIPMSVLPQGIGSLTLGGAIGGGSVDELTYLGARGLSIRLLPANGGTILSVRDDNDPGRAGDLYVIGQDQDIGSELGKIITMHYLKK